MKGRLLLGIILLFSSLNGIVYGQNQAAILEAVKQNLADKPKKTIEGEVKDVVVHLLSVPEEDRPFIRYFTSFAVPKELQEATWLELSFVCHSLAGVSNTLEGNAGSYYPIAIKDMGTVENPVENPEIKIFNKVSDTIVWIDIRNYNWTPQSWELVSQEDGYFVEPIIDYEINSALRLLSGNALLRADWFIRNATDIAVQEDIKSKNIIYNNLVYAQNTTPKTVKEFEKIWGLADRDKSRDIGNEALLLTVNETKNVARHNRILRGNRTEFGWLFATYDVNSESGARDFVQHFPQLKGKPPTVYDGGEIFASNQVQMQVYSLYNSKEEIVNIADAGLARHLGDVIGDARVKVATSCIDCHAAGPIPGENIIKQYIQKNGNYQQYSKVDSLRIERAYLSDKFEDLVTDSQAQFARALKKINGLTPDENGKQFLKMVEWYARPLDLNQVLIECGVSKEQLDEKLGTTVDEHVKRKVPGRLSVLLDTGVKIPRETWESPGRDGYPGVFQQTMILLNGLTAIETKINPYIILRTDEPNKVYKVENGTAVWINNVYKSNEKFELLEGSTELYYKALSSNNEIVFIKKEASEVSSD